ncbi:hypothetical protein AMJ39_03890 [candidate division TA06 bacterium DG_24]|uniref:Periplasmic copper-binding protein NosD beta helix domain-containing protein n=1 Tax=candidate division TA06 bacterium DG_24 TaxID=1703770 RepID=A0A0S7WU21_UNCT6|nr:MAG: hypothetical protein AMJ39_03890 [candidate division TA06 bacterium DG_24]
MRARGGGIYSTNDSRPTIIGNTITGNEASEHGGGIYCDGFWSPVIVGNTIFANVAACGGGGIACEWSDNTVEGNTIAGNVAGQFGGGISCEMSTAILVGNTIKGNTSLIHGGGISISGWSAPTITNNTIAENTASIDGGGIHFTGWCFTLIKRNSIDGNSAGRYGGGIYSGNLATSQALIIGNTVSGNTAYDGGGICCHDASPRIRRNTMTGNMAGEYGGAIYSIYSAWPKVGNCILWDNGATFAGTEEIAVQYGGGTEISYSDVKGGWLGEGNIDADPQFVHPGWKDYRLLWGSPCIDSGHPDYLDQDGTSIPGIQTTWIRMAHGAIWERSISISRSPLLPT